MHAYIIDFPYTNTYYHMCIDPSIALLGGVDRCVGQVIRNGTYGGQLGQQAIMCDPNPTYETAVVVCRQLQCGPPMDTTGFIHARLGYDKHHHTIVMYSIVCIQYCVLHTAYYVHICTCIHLHYI